MPQIEVAFDIDANGILHVSAKDRATSKEQSIRIEASSGLNESEIQKMVKDAEDHSQEDRKRKEAVEARNRADGLAYEVEKNLKEHEAKIDSALKTKIEDAVKNVREALKGDDAAAINSATDALQQVWHEAAAAMYQQAGTPGAGGGTPPPGAGPEAGAGTGPDGKKRGGDGAVDADFEVVN
jgi:molecular chaperone DnaK